MDKFYELLKKNEQEILDKFSYYAKRFQNTSYNELLKKYSKEIELGIFPRIVENKYPIIEGIKLTVVFSIMSHNGRERHIESASLFYIEDKINPNKVWIMAKMRNPFYYNVERTKFFCITKHYLERFEERNLNFKLFIGDVKEAAVLDLGLAFRNGLSYFINTEIIKDMPDYEERRKEILRLFKSMEKVVPDLNNYFSLEKSTGIMRTMEGYGIYNVEDTKVTMITWISEKMLTNNQRRIFQMLTPEKSLS